MTATLAMQAQQAKAALDAGARDPHLHNVIGWHHIEQGDAEGGFGWFQQALQIAPNDPETLTSLGALFRQMGRLRDAVLHCDAAIKAQPDYVDAWMERGFVLASGGSMAAARDCYERAALLDPGCAAAHAGIASVAARDGDSVQGRDHAATALRLEPANVMAASALATMDIEAGNHAAARDLLTPLIAALKHPSADRAMALGLLADAYAKLGDAAHAFANYAQSKADFAEIHALKFAGRPSHCDFIDGIRAGFEAASPDKWGDPVSAPIEDSADNHLFLMGYPRSGTTLVENILASIPGVTALEERPTMADADMAFLAEPDGMAKLAAMTADELTSFASAYWQKVAASGADVKAKAFVDMDPLKATRLPIIARLFPKARILIMRRDPRDVVWSCFHTSFALTNAAMDFTTLERAARHYDAMMRLTQAMLARLPLNTHIIDYHRLVEDFEGETRSFCAFAGLPYSEDLRRFDRTAKARGVATASAGQVRKGLYDGRQQWEPYARWLEPIMPILQPWVERFGYLT